MLTIRQIELLTKIRTAGPGTPEAMAAFAEYEAEAAAAAEEMSIRDENAQLRQRVVELEQKLG